MIRGPMGFIENHLTNYMVVNFNLSLQHQTAGEPIIIAGAKGKQHKGRLLWLWPDTTKVV